VTKDTAKVKYEGEGGEGGAALLFNQKKWFAEEG